MSNFSRCCASPYYCDGPRGPMGLTGITGPTGPANPIGFTGPSAAPAGPAGDVGPVGPTGFSSTGPTGTTGGIDVFADEYVLAVDSTSIGVLDAVDFSTASFLAQGVEYTAGGVYTVSRTGVYLINWQVPLTLTPETVATGLVQLALRVNATNPPVTGTASGVVVPDTEIAQVSNSVQVYLEAGNTIEVVVTSDNTSILSYTANSVYSAASLAIVWLGTSVPL